MQGLCADCSVSGVDFDDADFGFKEEDKSSTKANNEAILQNLVDKCDNGIYGTMAQAVEELSVPRIKTVKPFRSYDGMLTLGDPTKYDTALSIHVERFFKTKVATVPSGSTVVTQPNLAGSSQAFFDDGDVEMGGTEFSGVKQMRSYRVNDPDAPGGKKDIPMEELEKGYQYGRTVVPFSESDYSVIKLETKKQFSILGFIPWSSVCWFFPCHVSSTDVRLSAVRPILQLGGNRSHHCEQAKRRSRARTFRPHSRTP